MPNHQEGISVENTENVLIQENYVLIQHFKGSNGHKTWMSSHCAKGENTQLTQILLLKENSDNFNMKNKNHHQIYCAFTVPD